MIQRFICAPLSKYMGYGWWEGTPRKSPAFSKSNAGNFPSFSNPMLRGTHRYHNSCYERWIIAFWSIQFANLRLENFTLRHKKTKLSSKDLHKSDMISNIEVNSFMLPKIHLAQQKQLQVRSKIFPPSEVIASDSTWAFLAFFWKKKNLL